MSEVIEIKFIIPEWALGKTIHIFAGRELLGVKECIISHDKNYNHISTYKPLRIKPEDGRCTGCGECCKGCTFLRSDGCSFKGWIPFSCAKSICTDYEGCTERLEVYEP